MPGYQFLNNREINESNSLIELLESVDPNSEDEMSTIEHSRYYSNADFRSTITKLSGSLILLNINCGGLNAKFDKLKMFLHNYNSHSSPITMIILQETHLSSEVDSNYFNIPDYTLMSDVARINTFGGVAIYVHNSFTFTRLSIEDFNQNSQVYESMFIEAYNNNLKFKKYIIGNVYRRPSAPVEDLTNFISEFSETIHKINLKSKNAYICGDFNIDLLKLNSNCHYNDFYETITSQGFFPKITRPTRLSEHGYSLIDNIFTNNLCNSHTSGIIRAPISDHFTNFCVLEGNKHKKSATPKYVEIESINPASVLNFKNSVGKANIISKLDTSTTGDPNSNYNIFSSTITNSKNKHIPKSIKKFDKRKHKKEKWMTNELLSLIVRKNDLYHDWKTSETEIDLINNKTNFKAFEKIVDIEMTATKNKYFHEVFMSQRGDMKKTWRTINDTLNRNKKKNEFPKEFQVNNESITDPTNIANHFNDFFANIGTHLSNNIELNDHTQSFKDYLTKPVLPLFNFIPTNEHEVRSIINNLKNKTSSGKDEISNKLLKAIVEEVTAPLTLIINQSLSTGIYPDVLKIAKVRPLFKKGDKALLNNYRPISLLPTISKVFERVVYTQLYNYFNTKELLAEQQYGFRPQHSTELATIRLVDALISAMDEKKKT